MSTLFQNYLYFVYNSNCMLCYIIITIEYLLDKLVVRIELLLL